ncbi:MAG TPA: hypothetical protein VGW40_15930 [Allosphingosinicella sp.]|nr:hypothetical protein [Allosphingosinicella sp.]
MTVEFPWLQDLFVKHRGQPLYVNGQQIIQMDRIEIPSRALIKLKFLGDKIFEGNAAVIAVDKPDKIFLCDGSTATAVAIWDEPGLPREVTHLVDSKKCNLKVYNKYYITFSDGFVVEESFTGNAGMHVVKISENVRRYECSNAVGPVCLNDLVFELCWEPATAETEEQWAKSC